MESIQSQKQELKEKITDLETTLKELNSKLEELEKQEQHEAIDHLEMYLEEVDHHTSHLQNIGQMLVNEIRKVFA